MPRKPKATVSPRVMRITATVDIVFDRPLKGLRMGDGADMHRILDAMGGAAAIVPGAVARSGGRVNFSIPSGHRAKSDNDPIERVAVDPGRCICDQTPQMFMPSMKETLDARDAQGLDATDMHVRQVDDGRVAMLALSYSGLLWLDDLLYGTEITKVGSQWLGVDYTVDAAHERMEAAKVPMDAVLVEGGVGVDFGVTTLTALTPEGVRWVRLCKQYGSLMLAKWGDPVETVPVDPPRKPSGAARKAAS